jgi:S-methylmethionine-dependent homocysteine/selenocysteine methylase
VNVGYVVLDGAMGTELDRRGVRLATPAWSAPATVDAPEVVASIHHDYAAAGATLHTANTFRTRRRSAGARWEELLRLAVRSAREHGRGRVAGSIGPVEDCYRPDLSPGLAARGEHAEVARVLADEGVDVLLCETFPHPLEAVAAVEAAVATGTETWVALTAGPDATLLTPAAMRAAAEACASAGARAVLVGCTAARDTARFVEAIAEVSPVFGASANAGDARDGIGWEADPGQAAARYVALAATWMDLGASILGGCCGTRPEHIARVAALVNERRERRPDRS